MFANLTLLAAISSTCVTPTASVVVPRSTVIRSQPTVLYLVGQYQFSNRELIEELRALRSALASHADGRGRSSSAVSLHCGKCHSGGAAKGDFSIDDMDAADKLMAIRAMATDTMPPNHQLPGDIKNQILSELTKPPEIPTDEKELNE